jgi:hypothetical protein
MSSGSLVDLSPPTNVFAEAVHGPEQLNQLDSSRMGGERSAIGHCPGRLLREAGGRLRRSSGGTLDPSAEKG